MYITRRLHHNESDNRLANGNEFPYLGLRFGNLPARYLAIYSMLGEIYSFVFPIAFGYYANSSRFLFICGLTSISEALHKKASLIALSSTVMYMYTSY